MLSVAAGVQRLDDRYEVTMSEDTKTLADQWKYAFSKEGIKKWKLGIWIEKNLGETR